MFDLSDEVCHFLHGKRRLTETDVKLAGLYGPLLKTSVKQFSKIQIRDFIALAKNTYLPNHSVINNILPISIGRRFECFRLYQKFNDLPDLSSWVVSANGMNSPQYRNDFVPKEQRNATLFVNWNNFIPDANQSLKEYDDFFDALNTCAFERNKVASQLSIHRKLAELKIDQFANRNSKVMTCLTSESIQDFLKPYRFELREHILTKVMDNDLAKEAFEMHVPNFKTTVVNMNKPRQIDIKSS